MPGKETQKEPLGEKVTGNLGGESASLAHDPELDCSSQSRICAEGINGTVALARAPEGVRRLRASAFSLPIDPELAAVLLVFEGWFST
jgi:hypothetical protein